MRTIASLEELESLQGQEVAVSDWIEITQQQVNLFADATGDHQWIHVDVERARRESPFGAPVAHGFLTLSLLPRFMANALTFENTKVAVNYGLNRVRFTSPVPVGSRLRARIKLAKVERLDPLPNAPELVGGQAYWEVTIEREGSERPVCVAESITRRYG
ncbi:MaoC family dehydratase [Cupriavidus plantarum]|uniref:Acyl dehydratase n=1 Tax=Cupriavidus plantarum TaxID=942865 RepID=A0A316EZB5_9BURK|nr:MaoC family dehydratase [Cupriavidus plantarum]NYH98366.1 acyl dehydratase [Cupriavidus plantarum]PWK38004.1 acyl dehydratase [Cupriavidus plantarum]REF01297.1 acyl dehydratase [Cupriavidus plantarum]RLK45844.1 acyl dehydratase [Cupriavidus plantarum]CAG2127803.1 putative enoyl-CoA hydratase 1 [Cupriavidus plantarum]